MSHEFRPATKPTMYFIGVTTGYSSINQLFPLWARRLGLGECELCGLDFPIAAAPESFRAVIDFIKRDPLSLGALVTTHKVALCQAAHDQFDTIDPLSWSLGEISSIYKRGGRLHGRSVDPWTAGVALQSFIPRDHWRRGAAALILGAGGAGTALAWHLSNSENGALRPSHLHVADRAPARLKHLERLHASWSGEVPLSTDLVTTPATADALLRELPAGSLIVNATGLGKDAPGSPLSDAAVFPMDGLVWEFNYRGNLVFLEQARAQERVRNLQIEDGWHYFLHGWMRVIADVFDREIPTHGPLFDELGRIAAATR